MASGQFGAVVRQVDRLYGGGSVAGMDEGELLRRFVGRRDPVALEALVARHGPMVLGVCRRVLADPHDAEDAFQATFLVLVRRAGAVRDPGRLGPWLHGVARRVSVRSRADSARRLARERPGAEDHAVSPAGGGGAGAVDRAEVRAALDDEIARLPERFRRPVVLCYLEGLTHDQAAERLRCPVGTVRSRLAAGRGRLRDGLARRGVVGPAALAALLAPEAAPAAVPLVLLESTARVAAAFAAGGAGAAASGAVPAGVASLAERVTTTMMFSNLKTLGGVALAGALTLGAGAAAARQLGGPGPASDAGAERPGGTPENLIQQLSTRFRQSESSVQRLEKELRETRKQLDEARDELKAVQDRLAARDDATTGTKSAVRRGVDRKAQARAAGMAPSLTGTSSVASDIDRRVHPLAAGAGMAPSLTGTSSVASAFGPADPGNAPPSGGPAMGMGMGMARSGTGGGPAMQAMMGGMMGMGGGMGGGTPPKGGLAALETSEYIIVQKPEGRKVSAYSTETGEWATYSIPEGTKVQPVGAPGVVALYPTGDEIRQLAAYVPQTGQWFPIDLKTPVKGQAVPVVVPTGLAVYGLGRHVYAFSAVARSWDVLELQEGASPRPILTGNRATVEYKDHLYIFNTKMGKWTDFDAKLGKVIGAHEK